MDETEVIVGFTGTRAGLTMKAKYAIMKLLEGVTEVHHGDCVGADEQFHVLAKRAGCRIVGHPPKDNKLRAWCDFDEELPVKEYLDRNKDIVNASMILIGAPKETYEPQPARGQGTWSTIRYARNRSHPFKIVWPDGLREGK